jgi:hypothetical protein
LIIKLTLLFCKLPQGQDVTATSLALLAIWGSFAWLTITLI